MFKELDKLKNSEILDNDTKIYIRRGAGAYICGEESAMIESIEGKRGLPRHKPPFVSKVGLFGKPTLNHNIETVYWVRDILEKGHKWYSDQGKSGHKGPHSYSVSGRVKNPGVKLAPAGITMNELLRDYCGGMQDGHKFLDIFLVEHQAEFYQPKKQTYLSTLVHSKSMVVLLVLVLLLYFQIKIA